MRLNFKHEYGILEWEQSGTDHRIIVDLVIQCTQQTVLLVEADAAAAAHKALPAADRILAGFLSPVPLVLLLRGLGGGGCTTHSVFLYSTATGSSVLYPPTVSHIVSRVFFFFFFFSSSAAAAFAKRPQPPLSGCGKALKQTASINFFTWTSIKPQPVNPNTYTPALP
jgi:hypothetical protein